MIKKKVVAYARMSSALQKEESITRQLEMIYEFCEKNNLELIEEYIDEAMSGTNDRRDNFQRMIRDAANSDWSFIVVYKLDRLSRSVSDTMHYKKMLSKYGIRILSVIEDFDENTPEGNLFNLFTMGLSEFYVKNLTRESWGGLMQNARKCLTNGGTPPFGFDFTKDLQYVVNEHEAKAVRMIYKRVIEEVSYRDIARELNNLGYKTKHGNSFRCVFTDLLRNRKYIGEYVYNRSAKKNPDGTRNNHKKKFESEIIRIPNGIPRIVDDETFKDVQKILDNRLGYGRHKMGETKYLLSGLIKCGVCGFSISGATNYGGRDKKPRVYYQCRRKIVDSECPTRAINANYYEPYIIDMVAAMKMNKNIKKIQLLVNNEIRDHKEIFENRIKELNIKIEEYGNTVKMLTEKATSYRSSADKVLNEQINEHMEVINKIKDEKELLSDDILKMQPVLQKDIRSKIEYLKEMSQHKNRKKKVLRKVIHSIIQGNDVVKTRLRINTYLPYKLNNDILHEIIVVRDRLAYKYSFKYLKKFMED